MANRRDDIEAYRKGLLSAAERHALEKKALGDPFLADALEGTSTVSPEDLVADVDELHSRIGSHSAHWFTPLRIAAGILVVIGAGSLLFYFNSRAHETIALNKSASVLKAGDSLAEPADKDTSNLLTMANPAKPSADATPIRQQPSSGSVQAAKSDQEQKNAHAAAEKAEVSEGPKTEPAVSLDAQKAEEETAVSAKQVDDQKELLTKAAPSGGAGSRGDQDVANAPVSSRASKDVSRKAAESPAAQLARTEPERSRFSVTVSASGADRADDKTGESGGTAAPVGGMTNYYAYLEKNLRYPDAAIRNNVSGQVIVRFRVLQDGKLADFIVEKKLGSGCDEEVIRLIQEGPRWEQVTRQKPTPENEVALSVIFGLK